MWSINGSASAPSSATMKGTRWLISVAMKATSHGTSRWSGAPGRSALAPGSQALRQSPSWLLTGPVLPVDLLLLGDDRLDGFDEAQVSLVLLHVAVNAGPVHVEPLLALHPLRGGAVSGP